MGDGGWVMGNPDFMIYLKSVVKRLPHVVLLTEVQIVGSTGISTDLGRKMNNPCVLCVSCVRGQLLGANCTLDTLPQTVGKDLIVPGTS